MKNMLIATALVAGMASPAAASLLDFTTSIATNGNFAGTTWAASAGRNDGATVNLTNTTHWNNAGCVGYDCASNGSGRFYVGFGVADAADGSGGNATEIDTGLNTLNEYVQIDFGADVKLAGFAGMLTYAAVAPTDGGPRERVRLQYKLANGTYTDFGVADPTFAKNNGGGDFDTVGLAEFVGLSVITNSVRFKAAGELPGDDGNLNVTAAALQVAAVPVPAALPLMLLGVGAFGWAARRKKRMQA